MAGCENKCVLVLNGPNMNQLGHRQPHLYGTATLADVAALCHATAAQCGLRADIRHSNDEGTLIDWVQQAAGTHAGIVINPAGLTNTSVALMEALFTVDLPVIEVHITNMHRREPFRWHSLVSQAATGVMSGLGIRGYALALTAMADLLEDPR
jgi:3-dehydroquinate dehydratase-2